MVRHTHWFLSLLMLCFASYMPLAWAADNAAIASLDRSITTEGESVRLTIHVNGSIDNDPDLSVLSHDFDILNQTQSSSYNLLNAHMSRSKEWQINLMPKRLGTLNIPSISLGNMQTQALTLRVLKQPSQQANTSNRDIYLEVSAAPMDSYVQAQIILDIRLFRAVQLIQAQLSEPEISHATIKRLDEDKNYETVRNQRRFVVTERRYAIFPQQSGRLHIPALQFTGQLAQNNTAFFNQGGRVVRQASKPLDIDVAPMPTTWPSKLPWLPAEDISVKELPSDESNLKVGDALTRTIEIRARGLTPEQLPQLLTVQRTQGFKQYADKPELSTDIDEHGIIGIRREKIAMIPTQAGDLKLPAIQLTWWNTQTQSIQQSTILARNINVQENPEQASLNATQLPSLQTTASQKDTSQAISPTQTNPPLQNHDTVLMIWQFISGFLALAWLITIILWWRGKQIKNIMPEPEPPVKQASIKALKNKLKNACHNHDATLTATLLTQWGGCFLDSQTISHFSQLKGLSSDLDYALDELETCLYRNQATPWHGDALWQAIAQLKAPQSASPQQGHLKSL